MPAGEDFEIVLVALFVSVAGLNAIARWLSVPYPIALVLGGLVLGRFPASRRSSSSPNARGPAFDLDGVGGPGAVDDGGGRRRRARGHRGLGGRWHLRAARSSRQQIRWRLRRSSASSAARAAS